MLVAPAWPAFGTGFGAVRTRPKSETRSPKEIRTSEIRKMSPGAVFFGFRISFGLRISGFGLREHNRPHPAGVVLLNPGITKPWRSQFLSVSLVVHAPKR